VHVKFGEVGKIERGGGFSSFRKLLRSNHQSFLSRSGIPSPLWL
jgi:hypothetical protein